MRLHVVYGVRVLVFHDFTGTNVVAVSLRARILYTFVLSATCVWYTLVTLVFRYCVLWYVVYPVELL